MHKEDRYKGKYKTESMRLRVYDYSGDGYYFVTVKTKNSEQYFGENISGKMILNGLGKIVENEIIKTGKIRNNVIVDEFVIMGDHLHLILVIDNPVETHCNASLRNNNEIHKNTHNHNNIHCVKSHRYKNTFGPQINNLPSIIRGLKGTITNQINKIQNKFHFSWQSGYYEHIIRNNEEYIRIKKYIIQNPIKHHYAKHIQPFKNPYKR